MLMIHTVKDEKAGIFFQPFCSKSTVEALRSVAGACNDPKSMLHQYPDDFAIYAIGTMDEETGVITPSTPPVKISDIQSLIKKGNADG